MATVSASTSSNYIPQASPNTSPTRTQGSVRNLAALWEDKTSTTTATSGKTSPPRTIRPHGSPPKSASAMDNVANAFRVARVAQAFDKPIANPTARKPQVAIQQPTLPPDPVPAPTPAPTPSLSSSTSLSRNNNHVGFLGTSSRNKRVPSTFQLPIPPSSSASTPVVGSPYRGLQPSHTMRDNSQQVKIQTVIPRSITVASVPVMSRDERLKQIAYQTASIKMLAQLLDSAEDVIVTKDEQVLFRLAHNPTATAKQNEFIALCNDQLDGNLDHAVKAFVDANQTIKRDDLRNIGAFVKEQFAKHLPIEVENAISALNLFTVIKTDKDQVTAVRTAVNTLGADHKELLNQLVIMVEKAYQKEWAPLFAADIPYKGLSPFFTAFPSLTALLVKNDLDKNDMQYQLVNLTNCNSAVEVMKFLLANRDEVFQ